MSPHVIPNLSKKIDAILVAKTVFCVVAFIVFMGFFSQVCAALFRNYFILLMPTVGTTIPWLIRLGISSLLLAVSVGVIAVLVRPIWIVVLTCFAGAFLYALVMGFGNVIWIVAGIIFIFMSFYALNVSRQLKNQIVFSPHPLSDMKILLFSFLAAIISVSFALGYSIDSARHGGYILPPEIKTLAVNYVYDQQRPIIEKQPGSKIQKEKVLTAAREKTQSMVDDAEKSIKPLQAWISPMLGISLFFIVQMVFMLLSFVSMIILRLLFFIFKITRFSHMANEMKEITYITLQPVDDRK